MQFLTHWRRRLLVLAAVVTLAVPATMQATAHPPSEPAHGINETTFWKLWAGDDDSTQTPGETSEAYRAVASGTDIPLDEPPRAVERWNRADLREYPASNASTAIHPANASLRNGTYLKDAGVTIAAVQPSTESHLGPGDSPRYVAPDGGVLGVVDYRVAVPADDDSGTRQTSWSLRDHRVANVTLAVDGERQASTNATRTPRLNFSGLSRTPRDHTVALNATISVTLQKTVRVQATTCPEPTPGETRNGSDPPCRISWESSTHTVTETLTVTDERDVVTYDLSVVGYRAEYPNGDLGLVLYKNNPWLGYELPTGEVRGVWRHYVARDERWDTLTVRDGNGTAERHSPFHPLQVHAYPITTGPTASPQNAVDLLAAYGTERSTPTLPGDIALDTAGDSYTASYGMVTRVSQPYPVDPAIEAHGLVRGVTVRRSTSSLVPFDINRSNLTLTRTDWTAENVTVRVQLRDNATGAPIATTERSGYVVVDGRRINTTADGTATLTVPRRAGGVSARYVPGNWWTERSGYVGDSDVVYAGGVVLHYVRVLFQGLVPVGLLAVAGVMIERITGWSLLPLWRGR